MKLSDVVSGAASFAAPPPATQPPTDPSQPPPLRTGIDDGSTPAALAQGAQPAKPQGGPVKLSDVLGGAGSTPPPPSSGPLSPKSAAKPAAPAAAPKTKQPLTPYETQLAENNAFLRGVPGATYANDAHAALVGAFDWLQGKSFKEGYQRNREERTRIFEEYDSEHPVASTLRTLAGAGASMALTPEIKALQGLGLVGRSAVGSLFSGIAGTVQGFAEGATLDERKKNALLGGAFGTVAGLIFPPLGALARSPVGRTAIGTGGGAAVGAYEDKADPVQGAYIGAGAGAALALGGGRLSRFGTPKQWATSYLGRALSRDNVSKEAAQKIVSKPGRSLSDLGDESVVAASEQAALTGEGRKLGANLYIKDRMRGREKSMAHVVDHLISDQAMYESLDSLGTGRSISARPLYKIAFQKADSEAAFLQPRTQAFDTASKAARDSFEAVDAAERELTLAEGKLHRAGDNVYGVSSGNAEVKAATEKLEKAKAAHEAALSQKEHARGQLRTSQEDEESGARGGITTPYLQRFLAQPESKKGLAMGLTEARREAVAAREPFDEADYAVTGHDAEGNPIIGRVPTLRTYDAVKRGYDQMLEEYRDKFTHKIPRNQITGPLMDMRAELMKELDAHAPAEYAAARKAWEGPSRMIDAVYAGKEFASIPPELIAKRVKDLTPAEHDAYKIGVARWWSEMIGGGAGAPLKAAKRMVQTDMKERMLAAFKGDQAALDRLIEHAEGEIEDARRTSAILGGSQTARRTEGAKEFEELGPVADDLISGSRSGITGIAAGMRQHLGRAGARWIDQQLHGMSEARRAALGGLLFSKDREANLQAIEMLYQEAIMHPKLPWVIRHDPTPALSAGVSGLAGRMNTSPPPDPTQPAPTP